MNKTNIIKAEAWAGLQPVDPDTAEVQADHFATHAADGTFDYLDFKTSLQDGTTKKAFLEDNHYTTPTKGSYFRHETGFAGDNFDVLRASRPKVATDAAAKPPKKRKKKADADKPKPAEGKPKEKEKEKDKEDPDAQKKRHHHRRKTSDDLWEGVKAAYDAGKDQADLSVAKKLYWAALKAIVHETP